VFSFIFFQGGTCFEFLSAEWVYIHHCWEQLMISWDAGKSKKSKSRFWKYSVFGEWLEKIHNV